MANKDFHDKEQATITDNLAKRWTYQLIYGVVIHNQHSGLGLCAMVNKDGKSGKRLLRACFTEGLLTPQLDEDGNLTGVGIATSVAYLRTEAVKPDMLDVGRIVDTYRTEAEGGPIYGVQRFVALGNERFTAGNLKYVCEHPEEFEFYWSTGQHSDPTPTVFGQVDNIRRQGKPGTLVGEVLLSTPEMQEKWKARDLDKQVKRLALNNLWAGLKALKLANDEEASAAKGGSPGWFEGNIEPKEFLDTLEARIKRAEERAVELGKAVIALRDIKQRVEAYGGTDKVLTEYEGLLREYLLKKEARVAAGGPEEEPEEAEAEEAVH